MKIRVIDIQSKAHQRPSGYYEDVVSRGQVNDGILFISGPLYLELLKKYNPVSILKGEPSCCGGKKNTPKIIESPPTASYRRLPMPSLLTQGTNIIKAGGRVVKNVVLGNRIQATEETIKERQAICNSCEFWEKASNRCSKCGCMLKYKQQMESEHCPVNKW